MSEWKPDLYLKYEKQRSQPAKDLISRLYELKPKTIIDLGCGPGNSTILLQEVFPDALITGIDSSHVMIEKAKKLYPNLDFQLCDVRDVKQKADLIFSNACLHWLSDHKTLFPKLFALLNEGGVLAVQMPMNQDEPLYRIIKETAHDLPYDFSQAYFELKELLKPEEYIQLLSETASDVEVWESVYYHQMNSHEDLLEWVRSTRLRPYLDCLKEDEQVIFEQEVLRRARLEYTSQNGKIIFKFRRFFLMAQK